MYTSPDTYVCQNIHLRNTETSSCISHTHNTLSHSLSLSHTPPLCTFILAVNAFYVPVAQAMLASDVTNKKKGLPSHLALFTDLVIVCRVSRHSSSSTALEDSKGSRSRASSVASVSGMSVCVFVVCVCVFFFFFFFWGGGGGGRGRGKGRLAFNSVPATLTNYFTVDMKLQYVSRFNLKNTVCTKVADSDIAGKKACIAFAACYFCFRCVIFLPTIRCDGNSRMHAGYHHAFRLEDSQQQFIFSTDGAKEQDFVVKAVNEATNKLLENDRILEGILSPLISELVMLIVFMYGRNC